MWRRYVIVGYVRDQGFYRLDRPQGFLTHSGALIHATRAIRIDASLGNPRVEWHPIRRRAKVRTGDDQRWVRVRDLPVWDPIQAVPQRISESGIDS